jgi:hypothetical protein
MSAVTGKHILTQRRGDAEERESHFCILCVSAALRHKEGFLHG